MSKFTRQDVRLADLQCDPELWGEDATQKVREWLVEHYNPVTMPPLQAAQIDGKEGIWLLGWNAANTGWPPLLEMVFGREYADKRIEMNKQVIELRKAIDKYGTGEYGVPTDRKD
jgi:hypothetical protein